MNNIFRNSLKRKLKSGERVLGSWLTLGHPAIAEIFAQAGFDWLVVDLEHTTITINQAGELIRVIDLSGSSPLVRLTSNSPDQIKRVLDAGAHGIVVPMVNSAREAENAVGATRYAPKGNRGVGLGRAQGYGATFREYLDWQEDGPLVIVQIEHILAVENLEEILTVPGVDGFFVGPYDLSCSMGIPGEFNHADFLSTMKAIRDIGKRVGTASGLHVVQPELNLLDQAIADGYQFIAYGVDIRMLDVAVRDGIKLHRES